MLTLVYIIYIQKNMYTGQKMRGCMDYTDGMYYYMSV